MASRTSTDPIEILIDLGMDLGDFSDQDYLGALMEAIATIEFQTKGKGDVRSVALRKEVAKIRKERRERKNIDPKQKLENPETIWSNIKYGGPQARKTKISAGAFKRGSATGTSVAPKALPTSAIVPYQAPEAEEEGEEKKKRKKKPKEKNLLAEIAKSVVKIADILKEQYGVKKKSAEFDRKKAEQEKRALQKSKLSKGFQAFVKGVQKVVAPVQSLLSKVFGFLFNLLLGRFFMKMMDWIGDPKNRKKFLSVVRFLKDNWPKMIALYLVFGTSLGRFVLKLSKILIGGAVRLGIAVAKLAAAKGIGGARKLANMLGGKKARRIINAAGTAFTVGGSLMATNALVGGGEEQQTQGFSGGGQVKPAPRMSGSPGSTGGMFGALGSMFGPIGSLAGAGIGSLFGNFGKNKEDKVKLSKPSEVTLEVPAKSVDGGEVDGPGGIDKVPAMLTDGEFVMSRGAVQRIGVDKLEAMNAAGGGTNKPKVVDNKVFAYGGGMIGMKRGSGFGSPVGNYPPDKDRKEEKPKSSGDGSITPSAGPSMGYRLGQINPMQDLRAMEKVAEKVVDRELRGGQGGRSLGSTTQRGGGNISGAVVSEAEKIKAASQARLDKLSYEGKGTILSGKGRGARRSKGKRFDAEEKARRKEIQDRGGFLGQLNRSFTGMLDVLSGGKSRYEEADKASRARVKQAGAAAIGRYYSSSDGKYYKDYNAAVKAREKRLTALKTSQATPKATTKATTKTLTKEQLLGKSGVMPTTDQLSATATKRHAELMKSTDQKKIADYDAKHGAGAYSKKLQEKLNKMYSPEKAKRMTTGKVKPTGKVVGRENLSPQAQAAIARLEAKKGLPPDMQYTRNGKRISAEEFNRTKNMIGAAKEGGAKGVLDHMVSGVKGMFGGMFGGLQGAVNDPKSFVESMGGTVRDGNIGTPTAEEQKAIDKLNANRARADKREAESKAMMNRPKKRIQDDPLFAEYERAFDDPKHPLHDKVAGDLFDDTGTKHPLRFEEFKKLKAQQSQAKLSPNQPQPKISAPQPPTPPSNNVQVVKSGGSKGGGESQQSSNGSELPAMNAGNGSKSKFTLLGISF